MQNKWMDINTAPKDRMILLLFPNKIISSGEFRIGTQGEPQEHYMAWRCACCGRFSNPIAWQELTVFDGVIDE